MSAEGERRLKKRFEKIARQDFEILSEVRGRNLATGRRVAIDFMLYPKTHLLEAGFDAVWFGVEVKHFGVPGETGKMSRFIWQCITYRQSEFWVRGEKIRPGFVLGYSDVVEVNEDNSEGLNYLCQWFGMVRLAGLANVGMFEEFKPTRSDPLGGWRIRISSSTYFSFSRGRYRRHQKDFNPFKANVGSV